MSSDNNHIPNHSLDRNELRKTFIEKIAPWGLQFMPKEHWHSISDDKLIEIALLRAKAEDKLMLPQLFSIAEIKKVWQQYVVIQDDWYHGANIWAAQYIFKESDPEGFVKAEYQRAKKLNDKDELF